MVYAPELRCGVRCRAPGVYQPAPRVYQTKHKKSHLASNPSARRWRRCRAGGPAVRATREVSRPVLLNIRFPCVSAAVTSSAATCGSAKVLFSTTRCQVRRGRCRQGFLCESRPSERHGAADWSPSRGNGFSARAGRSQAPGWRVDCQAQS